MRIFKWVVIGLGVLAAGYLVRTCGQPNPADAETRHSQEVLALRDSFNAAMAERLAQESTLVMQANRAQRDALVYAGQLRTLQERRELALTARDTITVQDSMLATAGRILVATEERCNALDAALTGCQERAALIQMRLDTVESALKRQVSVSVCRVLFVRCPTRTQALAFGLLVGGLTGWVLKP